MAGFLKVELKTSAICRDKRQKETLRGLGLRRINQVRVLKDTAPIRGMIQKVIHLVTFEETSTQELPKKEKSISYQLGPKVALPKKTPKAKPAPKKEPEEKKVEAKKPVKAKSKAAPVKKAAKKEAPAKKVASKAKAKKES